MRALIVIGLPLTLVGACQSVPSGGCPALVAYSVETQRAAAAELRKLASDSSVAKLVRDYKRMRDACRAGGK